MNFFEKAMLLIFSIIILIISMFLGAMMLGFIDIVELLYNITNNTTFTNITLGSCIVLAIASLKIIFFSKNSNNKDGILLKNDNGKLIISKETLINISNGIIENLNSTHTVSTKVELDNQNNVKLNINLSVYSDVVIKELTINLQKRIKEAIKVATDLDVKEINVKIKNIHQKKDKSIEKNKNIENIKEDIIVEKDDLL